MSKHNDKLSGSGLESKKSDLKQKESQSSQIKRRKFLGLGALGLVSLPFSGLANRGSGIESLLSQSNMGEGISLNAKKLFVMDGHIHVMSRQLLQNLNIGDRYPDGTVDLPRIIEGGINACFFSVYTPEPYYPGRHEVKNTFRIVEVALQQIEKNNAKIELALNASDIVRISKKGKVAAFLDLEGGFDLDGDLNILRALYRLGLRSAQLTAHNDSNSFIDACYGQRLWGGINAHGRELIAEMNRLGMMINVAHASDEAILQSVEASSDPVIYSHGGFRGIVDNKRCISDHAAKALAAKGGVIGLQFGSGFNDPNYSKWIKLSNPVEKPPLIPISKDATIEEVDKMAATELPFVPATEIPEEYKMDVAQLARVIDYGVNLVGEDHVAFGCDFDGGIPLARQMKDISDYPEIIKAIRALGYSDERVRKICGLNWLRVIRKVTES